MTTALLDRLTHHCDIVETGNESWRFKNRSAMLARASDAFSKLTVGACSGLTTQPDGASEILVALSATEGAKLAPDLSKGARFQLYLALRIAGHHELAQSRPSVPFIADDIMETFDDHRATAAFGLLSDMSHLGKVIYLTHHRHLCDIALTAWVTMTSLCWTLTVRHWRARILRLS